ncbi:MAG: hypothetical protein M1826_000892 [Phylliscum demangeonii]|nr:MAG: hypothetical protein M1826_000892 [Phylliscum demangeonii]
MSSLPSSDRVLGDDHDDVEVAEARASDAPLSPRYLASPHSLPSPTSPSPWHSITSPLQRVTTAAIAWLRGPVPPQRLTIVPLWPRLQTWPIRCLRRYLPKARHQLALLLAFYFCWLLAFVTILHHSAFASQIGNYGTPSQISCLASYWAAGDRCGLNGNSCRPFDNSSFAFRCPANCAASKLLNAHAVGAQEIIYRSLVIGGPAADVADAGRGAAYRGDSFICAAAIHAGVVRNADGGCGVLRLVGARDDYASSARHGIPSVAFDSVFPLSFAFEASAPSDCRDLRWPLLAVSVVFTSLASLCMAGPGLFFASIFVGVFFHVGLASDPPNVADYYSIVSLLLGRFLPAAFVAVVLLRTCVRRQLDGLQARVEQTVLWLGGCWVGALTNYTFDFIPISRLTPHDLNQQPGAKAALAMLVAVLLVMVVGQIWCLRREGRLPRYLALYALMGVSLALLVAIPRLHLRIHHYILALLLLPGTALQTRPSLLYQGLLVGLFINGVARWGFDSILQTATALQGDAPSQSPLPAIPPPVIQPGNITFRWPGPLASVGSSAAVAGEGFDGMSVLVNDVERYRAYLDDSDAPLAFTWDRLPTDGLPYYFRFAFLQGSAARDYTQAGIWRSDRSWQAMAAGPSR